jgi:membrane-associated protein
MSEFAVCSSVFLWSFLETGLLLGLFLPAEKMLILTSILVSKGKVSPYCFVACMGIGTFLGYTVSYFLGALFGRRVFERMKVSHDHLERAESFVKKWGEVGIVIGRFFPVVRAVLPVLVGSFKPNFWVFSAFNAVGAILWALSYLFVGNLIISLFSLIIKESKFVFLLLLFFFGVFLLWRRYGKNKKLF